MKQSTSRYAALILAISMLASACSNPSGTPQAAMTGAAPTSLPTPVIRTTAAPDPETAAVNFLEHWQASDFEAMYAMLTPAAQQKVTQEDFVKRYQNVTNEAALQSIDFEILASVKDPAHASVRYAVDLHSNMVGDLQREMEMKLAAENGGWLIDWDETNILPELAGGNQLRMDVDNPGRESIYARDGSPLVSLKDAIAIGIYPDYIDPDVDDGLIGLLSSVTGVRSAYIRQLIRDANPGDYLGLAQLPDDESSRRVSALSGIGAVVTAYYRSRFYEGGGIAPHVVGYTSQLQQEEMSAFRRLGYRSDEYVGRTGIEKWAEQTLVGKHGGSLYVVDPQGKLVGDLGSTPSEPGQPIYTTIDPQLQDAAQLAIEGFRGAVVVMEQETGRVLAMASSPGFDPNAYQTDNFNWNSLLGGIVNDPNLPQINRAAEGLYPLGSVSKIITMAAALESGVFTPESTYECGYFFNEVAGLDQNDWTYDRYLEDGETEPSGLLTLPQGLIRSCNPWFWHMGLELYRQGFPKAVSDMARAFGLGSKTGIEGVEEKDGAIPDPANEVDAVNLAIGQGDMQVTPLQVARFIAAIANGGTLYRPQVIERIGSEADASFQFEPEIQGTLPIKPSTLQVIRDAMRGVVNSKDPPGTAFRVFNGLDVVVHGKTSTATSGSGEPHAWFAGFTDENRADQSDIAVVVLVENFGEGSEYAAPIFRRIIEQYFFGRPIKLYPWESAINVTDTPTPLFQETPTPEPTP